MCDLGDCQAPATTDLVYLNPSIAPPPGSENRFYRACLACALPHIDPTGRERP